MKKYEFSNERSSKRAKIVSIVFHLIVLGVMGIPFLIHRGVQNEAEEPKVYAVLLNFDSGSRLMGAQAKAEEVVENKNNTKVSDVNKADVRATEKVESKPVLVSENAEVESIETGNDKSADINEVVEEVVADAGQNNTSGGDGNGSGNGASGNGSSDSGDGFDGDGDGMFDGIGVLERKIIYRPNLKQIAKEEGVVSFMVCVNKDGIVTDVEIDRALTTFKDNATINKAMEIAKEFRFEKKNYGASSECGRLQVKITYA